MTPFVVAGCPVRNRAWIIERHVYSVGEAMRRVGPGSAYYLANDCADETPELLEDFLQAHSVVEVMNTGHPGWSRTGEHRYHDDQHANLAKLRNHWIDRALDLYPQATHFWMVDSDVVPDPDCLERLLAADKDIVAGVVRNGDAAWNFMRGWNDETREPERAKAGYERVIVETGTYPVEVNLLGACVLVRRKVLEATYWERGKGIISRASFQRQVRFGPHPRGEDFIFCAAARTAGFELWIHPLARTTHYMEEGKDGLR